MLTEPQRADREVSPPAAPAAPGDAWIHRHAVGVWRFLRSLGADPQLADELCQDAFVVAWRKGFAARQPAVLAAFLRTTARHRMLQWRAREQREGALRADFTALFAEAERQWQRDCAGDAGDGLLESVRSCVERLQGRARTAVQRTYRDGCSRAEVAMELGIKQNGVKTLLQRARQWLRACVAAAVANEERGR